MEMLLKYIFNFEIEICPKFYNYLIQERVSEEGREMNGSYSHTVLGETEQMGCIFLVEKPRGGVAKMQ